MAGIETISRLGKMFMNVLWCWCIVLSIFATDLIQTIAILFLIGGAVVHAMEYVAVFNVLKLVKNTPPKSKDQAPLYFETHFIPTLIYGYFYWGELQALEKKR
eukprot:m.340592 g.340592  ORF g.340592 m.340592 type:complete len:103 (-) comp19401_c0_seq1:55-363(-)